MTGGLYRLGRLCVRRRWIVLAVWLVLSSSRSRSQRARRPRSQRQPDAARHRQPAGDGPPHERLPAQANGTPPSLLQAPRARRSPTRSTRTRSTAPSRRSARTRMSAPRRARSRRQARPCRQGRGRRLHRAQPKPSPSDLTTDDAQRIVDARPIRPRPPGLARRRSAATSGRRSPSPRRTTARSIGLAMAVIVLLFTFGTVVAMGLPIITALFGLVCGLSIITLISHIAEVPTVAPTLATMIGLGVGIDYSLFVVTRHLEQRPRRHGHARVDRARRRRRSGGAIVFAGTHRDHRAAVAGRRRHPARHHARLHVGARRARRGDRRDHAPPGAARRSSATGSTGSPCRTPRRKARRPAARLAALGRVRHAAPAPGALVALVVLVALALPVARPLPRPAGQRRAAETRESRQAYDAMTAGFGVGANGAAAHQRRHVREAREGRPGGPRHALDGGRPEGQGHSRPTRRRSSPAGEARAATREQQAQAQVQPQLDKQIDEIEQQAATSASSPSSRRPTRG